MLKSQEVLLQLLKELDEICKKNDITYYLIGGSALGAVRHHGFLPWDDDADIVLTHENYMKFVEVMKNPANIPPNRAYEDAFIAPYTRTNVFGRYSATDTTCIFDTLCYDGAAHGIKVDVFHLIPCPDEGAERDVWEEKFHKWAELCHPIARSRDMSAEVYQELLDEMDSIGVKELREQLFLDLNIEKYTESSQYRYCYERDLVYYDKDIFREPVYFPFEDCVLPVPTLYTEHFRYLFGDDWFCIPDEDGQIMHLITQDVNRSYKEYISDYWHYASSEQKELRQEYKYYVFKVWEKQKNVVEHQTKLRKRLTELKANKLWEREKERIYEALKNREYSLVLEIAAPYLEEQFNSYTDRWEMFLEVDKELFAAVLCALLYTSQNKKARRMLLLAPEEYISDEIGKYKDLLAMKDKLIEMQETGEDEQIILQETENALSFHSNDRDLILTKVRLLVSINAVSNQNAIENICYQFPEEGEFIAVLARLYEEKGMMEQSRKLYEEAVSHTRNGMVILECKEKLKSFTMER